MSDRSAHCCLCGALRRPTQAPVGSFGNDDHIVYIADHRPLQEGRWEDRPQLLVFLNIYRNGGVARGQTHMCDDCILVGLRHAKKFVDGAIEALQQPNNPS
jgi:hypothetical protein